MNIVIFGAPGAGKGTQSALLVERLGMFHISTGDLFRYNMKNETELGIKAKSYVDKGQLVPDEVTVSMVEDAFGKMGDKSFILDGFPRNTAQAEALEEMLGRHGKKVEKAVFLHVEKELLMDRLTGRRLCKDCGAVYHMTTKPTAKEGVCDECGGEIYQRKDDNAEVIGTRLDAYESSTAPLIEYYKTKGLYTEINGVGESDEVFSALENALK